MSKHTPGPWQHSVKLSASENHRGFSIWTADGWALADVQPADENGIEGEANARLIAAAPTQHAEMLRYLPVLERAEADSELWARLTDGLGIATLNGYRAAIKAVEGKKT